MRILLNDGMHKEGIKSFEDAGIETVTEKRDPAALLAEIGGFDGLSVRSATKVTREVIEAGAKGNLKIIGRAGVGYDNIDVKAASEHGIIVKIAPHGNSNATAELALGLILAVSRNIPQAHYSLKGGVWEKKSLIGNELSHKILGIIGCGRIGQRLSQLVRGFDLDVIGYDRYVEAVRAQFPNSGIKYVSKEDLLSRSDYVSLHTGGKNVIIGAAELGLMKPMSYLINASRGNNVDEKALYEALKERKIAGAALDSYVGEPKKEGSGLTDSMNKFRELNNVVMSSHLGASSREAQRMTSIEMARVMVDYLKKGNFTNAVNAGENIEAEEKKVYPLFIYHRDVPGAFSKIDQVLADHGINIRENPSRQLGTDDSVMTVYLVHQQVDSEIIEALEKLDVVHKART